MKAFLHALIACEAEQYRTSANLMWLEEGIHERELGTGDGAEGGNGCHFAYSSSSSFASSDAMSSALGGELSPMSDRVATAGRSLPSINTSDEPPPVDTWETLSATALSPLESGTAKTRPEAHAQPRTRQIKLLDHVHSTAAQRYAISMCVLSGCAAVD